MAAKLSNLHCFKAFGVIFCPDFYSYFRKSAVSIKFPPVILGPEMAAPILWAPGIFWFFLLENPHAHKIPPFRGGGVLGFSRRGAGSANFIFMGVGISPNIFALYAGGGGHSRVFDSCSNKPKEGLCTKYCSTFALEALWAHRHYEGPLGAWRVQKCTTYEPHKGPNARHLKNMWNQHTVPTLFFAF